MREDRGISLFWIGGEVGVSMPIYGGLGRSGHGVAALCHKPRLKLRSLFTNPAVLS